MNVCLITCYIGRSKFIKRILASFLAQDYTGHITLLLYNNGYSLHSLGITSLPYNRHIILINNHLDKETGQGYTNTGAIFRDALSYVPEDCDIINFFDSDDLFLPEHVSNGVAGLVEGALDYDCFAYKPKFSYHIYIDEFSKEENNMEPSIFVFKHWLEKMGFSPVSSSYHQGWLTPLVRAGKIFIKEDGKPTFLYDWSRGHNTYKISGSGDDGVLNFMNHRRWESQFLEESILTPISQEQLHQEYEKIKHN